MKQPSLLTELVEAFSALPGVGSRTAQRLSFHLLEHNRDAGLRLASALQQAIEQVGQCEMCRTLTENPRCRLCSDDRRDAAALCIVENPSDVIALEQATDYRGYYFVLLGRLSPLDGIGPEQLGLDLLERRLAEGEVSELILATNPTVEGEVTAHFINELASKFAIKSTRIAHGVPVGGELDYVDSGTLSHAFEGRRDY